MKEGRGECFKGESFTRQFGRVSFRRINFIFGLSPNEIAEDPRGELGAILPRSVDARILAIQIQFERPCIQTRFPKTENFEHFYLYKLPDCSFKNKFRFS